MSSDGGVARPNDEPRNEQVRRWDIRFEPTRAEWSRALNRYWFRTCRRATISAALMLFAAVLLSCLDMLTAPLVAIWTAVVMTSLYYWSSYVHFRRRSMAWFRKTEDRTISYTFSDDGLAVSSELASSVVKWRALDELWRYPDMWLLVIRNAQYFHLPTRSMSEDLRAAIERWMRLGAGGRPKCPHCGYDVRGQTVPRCPECGTPFEEDALKIRQ